MYEKCRDILCVRMFEFVCAELPLGATRVLHNMANTGPTGTEQRLLSFQEISRARQRAERRGAHKKQQTYPK